MAVLKNAKHELFAQEVAKGASASEAYVLAGYAKDDGHASRLAGNGKVRARIDEILKRGAEKAAVTVASIVEELEEARALARTVEQPASMIAASMGKAKVSGLAPDKVEHSGPEGGPIVVVDDTEAARRIAFALARAQRSKSADKPQE